MYEQKSQQGLGPIGEARMESRLSHASIRLVIRPVGRGSSAGLYRPCSQTGAGPV